MTASSEPFLTDRFQRGNVLASGCPSSSVLKDVTSLWGVLALFALLRGTHRFSELRKSITGVSEKMLSQTHHALLADGFVLRTAHPVILLHIDYSLTESGREVAKLVEEHVNWIEVKINPILSAQDEYASLKSD